MARKSTRFGFRPFPRRGGTVTNELIDQLRDGVLSDATRDALRAFEGKITGSSEAPMKFEIECEREEDGRWLAEVPQLPGTMAYGSSADEAMARAEALALRVLAERIEHGEIGPLSISIGVAAA